MTHYARIENDTVTNVIVADEEFIQVIGGEHIQCSYNTRGGVHYDPETGNPSANQSKALRANFPGVGYIYDRVNDVFYDQSPGEGYTISAPSWVWEPPAITLPDAKIAKIAKIDTETTNAITSGFVYTIDSQALHFSYKIEDQQNFSDTANAATLAMMGVPNIPNEITWNGWEVNNGERILVRLTLNPQSFLDLYMNGALTHKATQMEIGSQRKLAVEAAKTIEEVEAI